MHRCHRLWGRAKWTQIMGYFKSWRSWYTLVLITDTSHIYIFIPYNFILSLPLHDIYPISPIFVLSLLSTYIPIIFALLKPPSYEGEKWVWPHDQRVIVFWWDTILFFGMRFCCLNCIVHLCSVWEVMTLFRARVSDGMCQWNIIWLRLAFNMCATYYLKYVGYMLWVSRVCLFALGFVEIVGKGLTLESQALVP